MSLKQEIETWVTALAHYDNNEFDDSLRSFDSIADTSKILFNCGVIHATLGEHQTAVQCYQRAVQLDRYLAIAYFQQGVSNFLMGDFEEALANFNDTLLYLRGNNYIDYEQLGLKFKLHSCEVLFNRGLCYIYLQQKDAGMQDLVYAAKEKAVPDHDVIDEAIREQAEGYTVFSIPVGTIYRPNAAKVKNLQTKNYLGKARLVAAHDFNTSSADARRNIAAANLAIDDRPGEKLSYAALNLVKPGLASRSRQQSEPPIQRNLFPPTPPPEIERPDSLATRRISSDSIHSSKSSFHQARPSGPKPQRLALGSAAFEKPSPEQPRLGTVRSVSERPPASREYSSSSVRTHENQRSDRHSLHADQQQLRNDVYNNQQQLRNDVHNNQQQLRSDVYDMQQQYQTPPQIQQLQPATYHQRSKSSGQGMRNRPISIQEEDEEDEEDMLSPFYENTGALAFEIIPPHSHRRRSSSRAQSRRPDIKKIRVKVHADDTRYVMIVPTVSYDEFLDQIRNKFGFEDQFKLKMRDEEGDMVTMGDQDDLDMIIGACRDAARADRADMGKMEIWVQEL